LVFLKSDYKMAAVWIKQLLDRTKLSPADLIVCAGNHDVDRYELTGISPPATADAADAALTPHGEGFQVHRNFTNSFQEFGDFCKEMKIPSVQLGSWDNHLVGGRSCKGLQFVVLNTAWFCKGEDKNLLWIGKSHLVALESSGFLRPGSTSDGPCIVVMHHPPSWLAEAESLPSQNRPSTVDFLARRSDLVLNGHTHGEVVREPDQIHSAARFVTAGATFDNAAHMNRFGLIKIEDRNLSLKHYLWNAGSTDLVRWKPHSDVFSYHLGIGEPQSITVSQTQIIVRAGRLKELARASRARCIERWQANGVQYAEACQLADDTTVGAPGDRVKVNHGMPLIILTSEVGAGKSLIAERLHQEAIMVALGSSAAPVPVYLEAPAVQGDLEFAVTHACQGLGDPKVQGSTIVINGADEASSFALDLLTQARVLANTWPNTRIVITSRPLSAFDGCEEIVEVRPLTTNESDTLIKKFSGKASEPWSWTPSVRNASRRPLFAILLGLYLRDENTKVPRSQSELLTYLVQKALQGNGSYQTDLQSLLTKLAVISTDRGGPVPISEVAQGASLQTVKNSGLVVERSGALGFALPILSEWFAAQGLAQGTPAVVDLAQDEQRLQRWRYPLTIAAGTLDHDRVTSLLLPLVKYRPGFAALIVKEGISKWGTTDEIAPPPAHECGQRIRQAMEAWVEGFGPLSKLIAPLSPTGRLGSLGILTAGSSLTTAWYLGADELPPILVLPRSSDVPGWGKRLTARPGHQSAWAWRWALNTLMGELNNTLSAHALPMRAGFLARELAWKVAVDLTGRTDAASSMPLSDIEAVINENLEGSSIDQVALACLNSEVTRLRQEGATNFSPPWKLPDRPLERSDDLKSLDTGELQQFLQSVYEGALEGYQLLVETWFTNLRHSLGTDQLRPFKFVGLFVPKNSPSFALAQIMKGLSKDGNPILISYFMPAVDGESNSVEIRPDESPGFLGDNERWSSLQAELTKHRPGSRLSVSLHGLQLTLDRPATRIAYEWLISDLSEIMDSSNDQ
jgi:hypothetical protein